MSRRRKILIIGVVVLGAAILIPVIHHYQLRAAVNAYIAELKAKGEPMELAQVIPPPVSPEQNSADTFRKAATLFDADQSMFQTNSYSAMRMVAPGKAMVCSQQPDASGYDATNSWEEIKSALAKENGAMELLLKITDRPRLDFDIPYAQRFTMLLKHLAPEKRAAQRLSAATLCDLHFGDTASAVKNVRAMLALVKGTHEERIAISQLVRIAIAQIALTANWEVLQSPNLTDEQLAALQNDWSELEFVQATENSLLVEREGGETTIQKCRESSVEYKNLFGRSSWNSTDASDDTWFGQTKLKTKEFMWRYWWSYPDELRALKSYEVLLGVTRFAETNYSFQTVLHEQESGLEKLGINALNDGETGWMNPAKMDMHSAFSQSVVSLRGILSKVMRIEAAKQMTITAIALKRYQLKHGNYPADLSALVPEFVPAVPLDPVDGQPLRYQLKANGTFLLYSVGENGKDDNGNSSWGKGIESSNYRWQDPHALDWVWPQPATPEEVQYFYEHPPK